MKTFLFFLSAILFAVFMQSCRQDSSQNEHDIKVYHQAIKFGDIGTATYAIHSLLARDSAEYKYYDTLSVLYFQSRNYPQAIQAAQNVLEKDTNNLKMVEVSARAYQAIGEFEMAIPFFTRIAVLKNNPEAFYQIGVCRFYLQQFDGAEKAVNKVIADDNAKNAGLIIGFDANSRQQQVPLLAAAHNMLGSIKFQQGNIPAAKTNFAKALEIFPDFELPKENLKKINR